MAASFVVAFPHQQPIVRVPLARGAIFPHPKVTTLGRVALGWVGGLAVWVLLWVL